MGKSLVGSWAGDKPASLVVVAAELWQFDTNFSRGENRSVFSQLQISAQVNLIPWQFILVSVPPDFYMSCAISCNIAQQRWLHRSAGNEMVSLWMRWFGLWVFISPPQCHFVKHFEMEGIREVCCIRSSCISNKAERTICKWIWSQSVSSGMVAPCSLLKGK